MEDAKSPKESIENLLENKNYEQLLELSFYHVDYHTPGDIQLIHHATGTTYWVRPTDWNITWRAMRSRYSPGESLLGTNTLLTKVDDRSRWKVKTADWNSWFKMTR